MRDPTRLGASFWSPLVGTFADDFVGNHQAHCRRYPHCCGVAVDPANVTQAAAAGAAPNHRCHTDPVCWRVFREAFTVRKRWVLACHHTQGATELVLGGRRWRARLLG
jgi:hypothetical protein